MSLRVCIWKGKAREHGNPTALVLNDEEVDSISDTGPLYHQKCTTAWACIARRGTYDAAVV